jgi:hypothetical protein
VRSIRSAWDRGDFFESGDLFSSVVEWAHPEIECVFADTPDSGTSFGVPDMVRRLREFLGAWEGWRVEADEYRALDDERVLVLTHPRGRGKASGVDIGAKGAELFQIREGKVTKLVLYGDRDRALADLGLAREGR